MGTFKFYLVQIKFKTDIESSKFIKEWHLVSAETVTHAERKSLEHISKDNMIDFEVINVKESNIISVIP